jgi:copper resistance protein B
MQQILQSVLIGLGILAPALFTTGAAAQTMSDAPAVHEPLVGHVLFDQFEYRVQDGKDVIAWDGQAWYGGDYHKVFVKTLGEISGSDDVEHAEIQLLYSRLIGHFWDVQGGVRYDVRPDPSRTYGVIGLQGLAPGFFELDLQGFVSNKGDISARLEAEYDILITQRLVLQPKAEINLAVQDVRELGVGSGVNDVELGLRLRYEIRREFAPYIGVHWERKLGKTADFARDENESVDDLSFVAGVRFWF